MKSICSKESNGYDLLTIRHFVAGYINTIKIIYQYIVFFIDIDHNILHKLPAFIIRHSIKLRHNILVERFKKG